MAFSTVVTLLVRLEQTVDGRSRVAVSRGKATPAIVESAFPLDATEIAEWREQPLSLLDPPKNANGARALSETGTKLFHLLFHGPTLTLLRDVQAEAKRSKKLLRIVLDLTEEWHYPLPWEGLHDPYANSFLGLQYDTVIARLLPDEDKPPPPIAVGTLRILAVISSPRDQVALNVEQEKAQMVSALAPLLRKGAASLEWLERKADQSMEEALVEALRTAAANDHPYNLLHYIGHARYNHINQEGELLLEGADDRSAPLPGIQLGQLLQESGLNLAFLNACEGAKGDRLPYRSVAAEIVQRGNLPLALANQTRIRDKTALVFAQSFYAALADDVMVEEAVMRARREVSQGTRDVPEWASSVYFTRYRTRPARLLPTLQQSLRSLVILGTLLLLMLVVGVSSLSLVRHFGIVAGIAMQAGFLSLVAAMGFLLFDDIRRLFAPLLGVAVAATVLVLGWFVWQPRLDVTPPPPAFRLTIEEPSPYAFVTGEVPVTALTAQVRGTVAGIPAGHHLWILVRSAGAATYAAGEEAQVVGDRFIAPTVLVGPISTRRLEQREYILQPVLVDEAGHRFLLQHSLQRWRIFHPDFLVLPEPQLQNALILRR